MESVKNLFLPNDLPFRIFFNPDCLLHDTGPHHPESSQRLQAIIDGCLAVATDGYINFQCSSPATMDQVSTLHSKDYLTRLEASCLKGREFFMSRDNHICTESFNAILAAAGTAIALGKHLVSGRGGFALTRPPGHHAGVNRAAGFCFLNHAGLAIQEIRRSDPDCRILIVDIDVHHGDGTAEIYQRDDAVFFFSIHGSPRYIYPGTGTEDDRGEGKGRGYTVNVPLPIGTDGDTWLNLFQAYLKKSASRYKPHYILVSAGFDAHKNDPFALMRLEDEHYLTAISDLIDTTEQHCPGRVGIFLEGGYSINVLKRLVLKIIVQLSSYYNR